MMCASFGRTPVAQQRLQRVDRDAVGLELDHVDVRAAVAQVQQRAVVRRRLDDHRVARLHQQLEQERVGLHRAVGDQHLLDARRRAAPRSTRAAARSRPTCRTPSSRPGRCRTRSARPSRRPATSTMSSDGAPRAKEIVSAMPSQDTRRYTSRTSPSRTSSRRSVPIASQERAVVRDRHDRTRGTPAAPTRERRATGSRGGWSARRAAGARPSRPPSRRSPVRARSPGLRLPSGRSAVAAPRARSGRAAARLALADRRVRAHEVDRGGRRRAARPRPWGSTARLDRPLDGPGERTRGSPSRRASSVDLAGAVTAR